MSKSYYNEKEARDLCRILLDSIKYCHDRDVVHRCVATASSFMHTLNVTAGMRRQNPSTEINTIV